jgi:hypothetical protein
MQEFKDQIRFHKQQRVEGSALWALWLAEEEVGCACPPRPLEAEAIPNSSQPWEWQRVEWKPHTSHGAHRPDTHDTDKWCTNFSKKETFGRTGSRGRK